MHDTLARPAGRQRARWRFAPRKREALGLYYRTIFRLAQFEKRLTCLNRGYAHLEAGRDYVDAEERFQFELYRQVAIDAGAHRLRGANVLEISSGLGGGLDFLSRTHAPRLSVGIEKALPAVISARKRFGLVFIQGDALDLRLPDQSFDTVVNIESSNAYFEDAFISETARVLRQGGTFAFADHRPFPPQRAEALMRQRFAPVGLTLTRFRDISANVARSDELDDARREQLLRRVPAPLRGYLRPMMNGVTTQTHRNLKAGTCTYFIAIFEKASAGAASA